MSYVLTAYLVDLSDLKSVVGSKDFSVAHAVEALISETSYMGDKGEAVIAQNAALRTLIMGQPLNPDSAADYCWVLWHICKVKGEEVPLDYWCGVRWEAVEVCGLEDLLTKTGPPIDLPPNRDIPSVGHIERVNIAVNIQAAEKRKTETDDREVLKLLNEYIGWLEMAESKKKDIVFFYG